MACKCGCKEAVMYEVNQVIVGLDENNKPLVKKKVVEVTTILYCANCGAQHENN